MKNRLDKPEVKPILILVFILFIAYACATPSSPTGGPPDEEGPEITETEPETGTTNFDGRAITFHFSEFIERRSITEAIVVEPDIGIPYSLDWGRKSLSIKFDEELPDFTTLIVTISTDMSDMNGNKLASPYKVAVSTGPEIDKGELLGRIRDAKTGEGNEGNRILLYRKPLDLTKKASYIAETDTGGVFKFEYLRQGTYKAFWVDDRNRNKIWEPRQERAQPFPREFIELEKAGSDTLGNLYIAGADTSKPVLQGVGLFSSRRMRMRFSEDIALIDSTSLVISDTLGNRFGEAYPLYVSETEPYVLFAQSEKPLTALKSFEVLVRNIADKGGNIEKRNTYIFPGSSQKDTTKQRTIKRVHESGIYPTEPVDVIYAKPISGNLLRDSLKVVEGTKLVAKWPDVEISRNHFRVLPGERWQKGIDYEFRFWDPLSGDSKNVQPVIWHDTDLGALNILLEDTTDSSEYRLKLSTEERGLVTDTTFSKAIEVDKLAPVNYQVTIFLDRDGNDRWDAGRVDPYKTPEPYFIRNEVPVKQSFTSDLAVSMKQ